MNIELEIQNLAKKAKTAANVLANAHPDQKNEFLKKIAELLQLNENKILDINAGDVEKAKAANLDEARINRLQLTPAIIAAMRAGCLEIAAMPDPIGAMETQWQRPNGLLVGKMRIPLGVIAMIYEARPNVTIDAATLCIKAGNAVILRGGHEALASNIFLMELLSQALTDAGLPADCAQLVDNSAHEAVICLCKLDEYIDVIIPRGGEKLIRTVCAAATMPVLKHYKGVCHIYVDADADLEKAVAIVVNAKAQRPGVCNALECLLVNKDIASKFLPALASELQPYNIELRAEANLQPLLGTNARAITEDDLGMEFHGPILAIVVVDNLDMAMVHIARYGSHHTEVICTENYSHAMRFVREVDASMTGVNVSTRFNDGGQLGLGAEIGISTSKLHSYGPMGIKELTSLKFVVLGNGQIRQ